MARFLLVAVILFQFSNANAQGLREFLKDCAWGTLGGAALGVVSLAMEDKPSESWGNVAKGASLGLYVGIAYGLYDINRKPVMNQAPDFAIVPKFQEGKVDGIVVTSTLLHF